MKGWLVIAAAVSVVDVHAVATGKPTLSLSYRGATKAHPLIVAAGTTYLIAHLYGVIPPRYDPLRRLGGNR